MLFGDLQSSWRSFLFRFCLFSSPIQVASFKYVAFQPPPKAWVWKVNCFMWWKLAEAARKQNFGSEISTAVWEVRVRITVTEASQGWPRISPWNLATWHEMDPTIFLVWVSTPTLVRMNAIKRKTETSQGRNIEKHCQVLVKLLWETVQGADCLCLCSAGAPARLFPSFNISQISH